MNRVRYLKGWHKTRFCYFFSKFQILSKNVCYKVSLYENVQRQRCSYIISLSCGRRPHLPKIFAQSDRPPLENADFDRFRLIVPQVWELARKIQLAPIRSRPRAFQRVIDEPCTLPLSPPKGGSKRKFLLLALSLHFFVAGNRRHFKLNMWVEHSKSQPTDDKMSLKWAWPRHVTHFKRLVPLRYLWNGLS